MNDDDEIALGVTYEVSDHCLAQFWRIVVPSSGSRTALGCPRGGKKNPNPFIFEQRMRAEQLRNKETGQESFSQDVRHYTASVRPHAMFPKIDALPCAEGQLSADHGQTEVHRGERATQMRWHVVITLAGVTEQRIAVWHQPREESLQVAADFRISILLDQQRR